MQNQIPADNAQTILNQIVMEYYSDKKRERRWRWVKRVFIFILFVLICWFLLSMRQENNLARMKEHVGIIDIKGEIFDKQAASAENFMKGISKAYENTSLKALIFRIDSPGGSPVQADYIFNIITEYRKKHPKIKTYAVCVDTCASAAYYIAAAAEEVYASPSSLVGSIGVIYNGFGFVDTMQKLGVTRRLQTAGHNKAFMDSFSPENPEQAKNLQAMLDIIHQQFIARVKEGRGDRLKIDADTFSGAIWTGVQAKERGLIDGFASSGQLARNVIKIEDTVNYTNKQNVFDQMTKNLGAAMVNQLPVALGFQQGIR